MKRIFVFLACASALFLASCTGDSQLPNPTGKGVIRAIHAIPDGTDVTFKIEERSIGTVNYKQSSVPARYDDFEYNFNFDIFVPEQTTPLRIASVTQKIDVNREYVFALTGSVDTPTVTTWITDLRQWEGAETVFEARFAHLSVSLGDIDVYFDDPANPPSADNLVATLSPGNIMDIADFAEGTYVATITAAGDPNRVPVYTSGELAYAARTSHVLSVFDGNANDTGPYILGTMTTNGASARLPDPSFPPTVRFVHSAQTLPTVDVYDDESLTNRVASGVAFGTATPDVAGRVDPVTYYFTPQDSTATTLFTATIDSPTAGSPGDLYLAGVTDEWQGFYRVLGRAPVSTAAKISIFNAATNNVFFDLYIKDRDDPLVEDDRPFFIAIGYGGSSSAVRRLAGSYDLYLTTSGTKTVLAGPYPVDVALGDVVLLVAADDVDPQRIDIRDVSVP